MALLQLFGFYIYTFLHTTYILLNKKYVNNLCFAQCSSCLSTTYLNEINASFAMQCLFQTNLQNNMFLNLSFVTVFCRFVSTSTYNTHLRTFCTNVQKVEDSVFLRYDGMSLGNQFPLFRKNIVASSSRV